MHLTAMENGRAFFDCYARHLPAGQPVKVVEIGSQDVNGSLKQVCPERFTYVGVDFAAAKNVDIVLEDPYTLPFEDGSVDVVVSSSCLEHSEMFWLVYLEVLRILKPHGLFYLNAPSKGTYHRYPVDCWRFYPDSGLALVNWAKKSGFNPALLESYTEASGHWGDFVAIFVKDATAADRFPNRVTDSKANYVNARQERLGDQILGLSDSNRAAGLLSLLKKLVPSSLRPLAQKVYDRIA